VLQQVRKSQILLDAFHYVALLMLKKTHEITTMNKAAEEAGCLFGRICFGTWPKYEEPLRSFLLSTRKEMWALDKKRGPLEDVFSYLRIPVIK